jgi:hypothetical protein
MLPRRLGLELPLEVIMISVNATILLAALVILGLTSISIAAGDVSSLVELVMPGVVLIKTYDSNGNELGQGSGFVISKDGDVVTCYHVMRGYSSANVTTSDSKEYRIKNVTALNKSDDLARISLATSYNDFNPLKLNTTTPKVGQEIIAIGGPLGLEKTVSQGIVSAIRNNTIQITAPISPGSSGGPVFNMNGEVIGIVASQMKYGQNLNFAIPANLISTMQQSFPGQVKELLEPYYPEVESPNPRLSEEEIHEAIIKPVEEGISANYLVQNVKCNIFDNKSMLIKIYISDSVDARTLRYGNLEMLKSSILGHALAVDVDPSVEDMTVQICKSTAIQCTMCSAKSLISMSLNDLVNRPGQLNVLVPKMLSTMTPVIGSHLVSGRFVPVKEYGEYFNP